MEIFVHDLAAPMIFAANEILDRQPKATVLKIKPLREAASMPEELIFLSDYPCVALTLDEDNLGDDCLVTFSRAEETAPKEEILDQLAGWDSDQIVEMYGALSLPSQKEIRKILFA